MLANATNQPKSNVELSYMCLQGLSGQPLLYLYVYTISYVM